MVTRSRLARWLWLPLVLSLALLSTIAPITVQAHYPCQYGAVVVFEHANQQGASDFYCLDRMDDYLDGGGDPNFNINAPISGMNDKVSSVSIWCTSKNGIHGCWTRFWWDASGGGSFGVTYYNSPGQHRHINVPWNENDVWSSACTAIDPAYYQDACGFS